MDSTFLFYHNPKTKVLFVQSKYYVTKSLLISNLRLGDRQLTVAAGDDEIGVEKSGGNGKTEWAALRAAHVFALSEPLGSVLVRLLNEVRTAFQENS